MIVDTHAHIYSEDEERYPVIPDPLRPPPGTGTPERLRIEMDTAGVGRVMMVQTTTYYGWDNTFMRDSVRRCSAWAAGVYTLDPEHPHSEEIMFALSERAGMRALRTYPVGGHDGGVYDHPATRRMYEAARENGIVINVLLSGVKYADELSRVLDDYPDVRAVLDHCISLKAGEPQFDAKVEATVGLARHHNLHAKLTFLASGSAEEYPFRDMHAATRRFIDAYGPDRCIWGSSYPTELWAPRTTYAGQLALFQEELGLSAGEKDAILESTAERLFFS